MKHALLAAGFLAVFTGGAFAQAPESVAPPSAAPEAPLWSGPEVTVSTSLGDFIITLDMVGAPKTAGQFLKLVRSGHYNNARWFRIEPGALIQIGDEDAIGKYREPPLPAISLETANNHHKKYAVALANGEPKIKGRSSWYVDLADNSYLNATEGATPNTTGFAVFGHVTSGFDVVDRIGAVERLPTGGPFPGKLPKTPVIVKRAIVSEMKRPAIGN